MSTPVWTATVTFVEDEEKGVTWARAVLHSGDDRTADPGWELAVEGRSVRWPGHAEAASIGREWAASRAFTELGHRLGERAFAEVTANTLSQHTLGPVAEP